MDKKVYAVVVTYQPNEAELLENLEALEDQVDIIVICNNSSYSLSVKKDGYHILEFGKNLGIAEAQDRGMDWAYKNGAYFTIQMDQDSKPDNGMVETLMRDFEKLQDEGYKIGLIGPQDYDKATNADSIAVVNKGQEIAGHTGLEFVDATLSSGSLVSKEVYQVCGGPEAGLFIDAVDFEYCWRIEKCGFRIVRDKNARLCHQLGEGKVKIAGVLSVGIPSPIRHYYAFRNTFILIKRGYAPLFWKFSNLLKVSFKLFVYPLVLDNGKKRFQYMVKGIKDGLMGKLGAIDE